jgi:tetratricopeptide (TPR) repeat protein
MKKSLLILPLPALFALACGHSAPPRAVTPTLASLREAARVSPDAEVVGRWLLTEQVAPGGDVAQAAAALQRLATLGGDGLYASFARGLHHEEHGHPAAAADGYVATLRAASRSSDPISPLLAWFCASRLRGLRGSVAGLYDKHRAALDALVEKPGSLGWRSAAELADWSLAEAHRRADATGKAYDSLATSRGGCIAGLRLAGPFGKGTTVDRRRSFEAESPGPWPAAWKGDAARGTPPHQLKSEQSACLAASGEAREPGVYYVEGFVRVQSERDVILAVQGGIKVWIDDAPVLERDLDAWGSWQKFGVALHLREGRHRIVARLLDDATSIRMYEPDGTPARVTADRDARAPYVLSAPQIGADPNPIAPIVAAEAARSPIEAFVASTIAHIEGLDDVASVLIAPLVEAKDAGPVALESAGLFAAGDGALPADVRRTTQRTLVTRAAARDPGLWFSRAWGVIDAAEQKGLVDAVEPLRKLVAEFPDEPEILEELAKVYGKLGWRAERLQTLEELATRFADDVRALRAYAAVLDDEGPAHKFDAIGARIGRLDPDAEIDLDRALARRDWKAAIAELDRLQKRRPDRKELASRIAAVLQQAGDPAAAVAQLEKALSKNPDDATSRFRLADRAYAGGDTLALRKALAEALRVGASTGELQSALDLLEGATDLEPYRRDGRAVIDEFEAWEKRGKKMEGIAARVLDYAALRVKQDGSSQMLEHEILRIQSQEAVGEEAEQRVPTGLTLKLRVIKPNGKILEPEAVSGKSTLTMPNLEVGDYLEIEHITDTAGDGEGGLRYQGPQWFFREADKGYWRSEFVVVSPKDRALEVETRGSVGAVSRTDLGVFVEQRWRVDESPPLVAEPEAPSPAEFLPSVRLGWGISLDGTVSRLIDAVSDATPLDPRLRAYAEDLVRGVPASEKAERARRVYRAVLDRIQDGQEKDGRRVVLGKSGSRQAAFVHLCKQLGISVDIALAKDKLAMPPIGRRSEVEGYDALVLRVGTGGAGTWMTVSDKFAPFGYVPAEMRGQPAIVLVEGAPREVVAASGPQDALRVVGRADLKPDGSAVVTLEQSYAGKAGIRMRGIFDKVQESQLYAFVESRLLSGSLPGARVRDVKLENQSDLDKPLVLRLVAELPQLARAQGDKRVVRSPFPIHLSQLASLPQRQTPLLIGASSHVEVTFDFVAPDSVKMPATVPVGEARDGERVIVVRDAVRGHVLHLERVVDIPAGRVTPETYAAFVRFTQTADELLEREIAIGQ